MAQQTDEKGRPITYWGGKQNKQQTAVEFLVELLPQVDWDDPYYRGILQEAKDMEKEQMIKFAFDFYYDYSTKVNVPINLITDNRINAEQYYNETYKNK